MGSDDEGFRRFVVGFSPTLLRAAFLLLRDRGAAEDALQSTLLRTYRRWRRARVAPEAYSQKVLVNVCRDYWRYQRRHPVTESLDEVELREPVTETWARVEERQALEQLLGELTPQQREVVVLRFYLDLSVAETAELLGIAEGTVKSAAHRGLAQLRGLLSTSTNEVRHARR
jgi:RNA polymerase sigma-70 factor (sigma-E family)